MDEIDYKIKISSGWEGQQYNKDDDEMERIPKTYELNAKIGPVLVKDLDGLQKLQAQIENLILLAGGQTTLDNSLDDIKVAA